MNQGIAKLRPCLGLGYRRGKPAVARSEQPAGLTT